MSLYRQVLSSSKKLSEEISVKQEIATKTEEEIDKTRGGYKPVSEGLQFNLCSKPKNRYSYKNAVSTRHLKSQVRNNFQEVTRNYNT